MTAISAGDSPLRRALRMDPHDEKVCRHLMQARLRQGHRQEALSVYREYAWTLIREMGAPPAERMRALADQAATLVKQTR